MLQDCGMWSDESSNGAVHVDSSEIYEAGNYLQNSDERPGRARVVRLSGCQKCHACRCRLVLPALFSICRWEWASTHGRSCWRTDGWRRGGCFSLLSCLYTRRSGLRLCDLPADMWVWCFSQCRSLPERRAVAGFLHSRWSLCTQPFSQQWETIAGQANW